MNKIVKTDWQYFIPCGHELQKEIYSRHTTMNQSNFKFVKSTGWTKEKDGLHFIRIECNRPNLITINTSST